MNKIILILTVLLLSLFVTSCGYQDGSRPVVANDHFTLDIPYFMEEFTELLPGSDIQYANRFRNLYLIGNRVNPDTLQGDFNDFVNNEVRRIKGALENALVYDSTAVSLQNAQGSKMEIFGKMNKEMVYYHLETLKTDKYYYYVCIWTRGESRWSTYKTDMNAILSTFKEI